jgi:hypothetical protein
LCRGVVVQPPKIVVDIKDLNVKYVFYNYEQVLGVGGDLCGENGLPDSFPLVVGGFLVELGGFEYFNQSFENQYKKGLMLLRGRD